MHLRGNRQSIGITVGALALCSLVSAAVAQSAVWKCTEASGAVTFQDRGGTGCRELMALPELQSTRVPHLAGADGLTSVAPEKQPSPSTAPISKTNQSALSESPFAATVRSVPALSYHDLPQEWKVRGWSIPNKGDVAMVQIEVAHWPAGNGPHIEVDPHFKGEAPRAFRVAVLAAAKAVQYNARFIHARLTMPVGTIFHGNLKTDGPSAGVAWAVAAAAALLGDTLRTDVCLTGTINDDLVVGPVGGLDAKIDGCHLLPQFRDMLIPTGQRTFALIDKAMGYGMTVREVATLADAYEQATGQSTRPMP